MSVITRFAPSPTGMLHIGSARTALFNYLFAKNKGGKFLLRIEDTDQKRSTKQAVAVILEGLQWLGIENDGLTYQSHHIKRHKQIAEELLAKGKAYYCYTPAEELVNLRKEAEKKGQVFRFQSPWRDKQPLEKQTGIKPVIRIKSPLEGHSIIEDLIQGKVKVENKEIDDFVLLRNDGTPTYMLAVVVDDHDMNVTHILRGDDHLTNSFKQKVIYDAMGWKIPELAHFSLIHGADGAKMSKRHGATSITEYKQLGYIPEAMRNYLLRLGWSHGNDEIINDQQAINWFNIENLGKSPARFDKNKLSSLNSYYIKQKSEEDLFKFLKEFVKDQNPDTELKLTDLENEEVKTRILKALEFIKTKAFTLSDILDEAKIYVSYDNNINFKYGSTENFIDKQVLINDLKNTINNIDKWNLEAIKEAINNYAANNNLKIKDFGPLLRLILTGSNTSSGGIFNIIEILGKKEILARFAGFNQFISQNNKSQQHIFL